MKVSVLLKRRWEREGGIFVTQIENDFVKSAMHNLFSSRKASGKDISEIRKIVEPTTSKIAASRITSTELNNLDKNVKYCENKLAKNHDFPIEIIQALTRIIEVIENSGIPVESS